MRKKISLCIAVAFLLFQCSLANIYHVSTSGDDSYGDGSASNPWRTIKHAVRNVRASQGHTIRIAGGTYVEKGQVEIPVGVNVEGAGKNLTIIKIASAFYYNPASPGYATEKFLFSLKSSHQTNGNQSLRGFTIDGDLKQLHGGIYVRHRDHVIIDGIRVQNTNFNGIWLWDVKDSKIRDTELLNCSWGSTEYCVGALNLGNLERVEIDRLVVNESIGYGIKAIGPNGYNSIVGLKIHDSHVSVNPYGLWNDGKAPNIAIELWQVNLAGCEIYNSYVDNTISLVNTHSPPPTGVQAIRVHHNTIDMETRAKGAGYGVELSIHNAEVDHNYFIKGRYGIAHWDNPVQNWNIHHNVFYALEGFYPGDILRSQRSGLHNVNFYNNTIEFTGTRTMNVIGLYGGISENVTVVNNLFINNNTGYSYYPNSLIRMENGAVLNNLTVKSNLFDRLPRGSVAGIYSGNVTGDPEISKLGSRPAAYYAPAAGSPLIDAGLNIALGLLGLAPDIGAYEYTANLANIAPEVSIISPANNGSFIADSAVTITANASDSDGTITKVEFYHGTTKLGEDLTSPYNYEWPNVAAGSYSLTAKATDDQGTTATSSAVAVTMVNPNQVPSVNITGPAHDDRFATGSTVIITAIASDPDGTISKVEFFNGTTKLGEDLTSPYSYDWANLASGSFSLTAKATDNDAATSVSAVVVIKVAEPFIKLGLYAPDASLKGNMKLTSDPTASKGSYFSMPVGYGTNHYIPPPSFAQFYFELPQTDTYVAWVRLKSPAANNRGYHIYDGKGNWTSWLSDIHTEWTWVQVTNAYTNEIATFPYMAGSNIFRMAWFHENVQVDRVLITNDVNFQPYEKDGSSNGRSITTTVDTMEEEEPGMEPSFFPNPVKDTLVITYTSPTAQQAEITVKSATSANGKQMTVALHAGLNRIEVNMDDAQRGVYIVSIATSAKRYLSKIMVIN